MAGPSLPEQVITGARIVGPSAVFDGSVLIRDGRIADVSRGRVDVAGAMECDGDFLLPGLVELHTDTLERHLQPRPGVAWPRRAAVAAHDGEFASVGVTTVFDALRVGVLFADSIGGYAEEAIDAIDALRDLDLLRADHFLHIRAEICAPTVLEEFDALGAHERIRFVSLMDHTIGQRQFAREDKYREYYGGTKGMSEAELDAFISESRLLQERHSQTHREALAGRARNLRAANGACTVASHDDATAAHVEENLAAGASVAEFPTTAIAAKLSREAGLKVLMGAPNLLRGFSHSGNVSALDLAEQGLVDILSSDYAPSSLMMAAFKLAEETDYGLPAAIATVSRTPAQAVGLTDRGAIEPGLSADLVRVYRAERLCVARGVWRAGRRVA